MKLIQRDMLDVMKDLPAVYCVGPTEAKKLAINTGYAIHRGRAGYTPCPSMTDAFAAEHNARHLITAEQAEAMQVGSMFGWHVPGADPLNCGQRAKCA